MRTLKLAWFKDYINRDKELYKVILAKNTTAYHPGEVLGKAEVTDLCQDNKWDVTIVSPKEEA